MTSKKKVLSFTRTLNRGGAQNTTALTLFAADKLVRNSFILARRSEELRHPA